ncbi:SgcJ/EcaC family oxidoreductase [Gordonia sp. (in: high G+C Gram-positive bacteria)]|uniref:SgcJ/EcaC family oxidoreductase n=1 Tax=Gordonia sp. (in: high G+C Gram-positive bacteria) TaxID=84139 RepID=UPI00169BC832|nr:SgcJ/EcaC family oxidoreductase [Gordonia sp. (in: high G+C Gram-positive bacteria)]NLG48009.1 SgcJ/EcaC family oxidoreductase [Gordonia sp. (in: high G+C Gram-positive bacteria)]
MTAPDIKAVIENYLAAVASGDGAAVAALYAADATLEDPVGSEPHRGRDAISAFYGGLQGEITTELLHARVSGLEAAFSFRVVTKAGDTSYIVEPIDVMTFDDAGQITSMRAFWAPTDMVVE